MSEKRKRIFKEALFIVPFMLIVTVVSLVLMFFAGRTPRDMVGVLSRNFTSDKSMDLAVYSEYSNKKYTLIYSYGDNDECVQYAEFSYNAKGDNPTRSLTLLEARDGFDPGYYKTEWFHAEEYVTYAPIDDEGNTELYEVDTVPLMHNLILSYSWESQMSLYGADFEPSRGFKVLGFVSLYTWDSTDRQNILWGLGGNPRQLYSYINNADNEYKKISFK